MDIRPQRCVVSMKMTDFLDKSTRFEAKTGKVFNLNNEQKETELTAKIGILEEKIGGLERIRDEKDLIDAQLLTQQELNTKHFNSIELLNKQVSDLTAELQDKQRVLGTFDELKQDNVRLATENGEAVHTLSNLRMDLLVKDKELNELRLNNASLDNATRSLTYAANQKESLLQELTKALEELTHQHEGLTSSSNALAREHKELQDRHTTLDKENLLKTQELILAQRHMGDAEKHEREALSAREKAVEGRIRNTFQDQIDELNQDIKDLVTLNNYYKQQLRKPNRSSIGAIAKQEAFKLPLASNAINYRKNNLGTGAVTLPRFQKKEISP